MPKSNRAFYANQRQERNLGEAVILISQQPAKYQMCSPQFPTNKFQNGSFWFIVTFLKNAKMPYEYAVFMNLCENSWRVQLPPPPPYFSFKTIGLPCAARRDYIGRVQPNTCMEITKLINGDSWDLVVPGRIDGAAANQLEVEVLAGIKAGAREIFINLSQAEWICSAGIRVLLQYHRQMKSNGKVLLVTLPSPGISEILEMTGFRDVIVERR
jgi:anti-sigma B factor antagonist